MSITPLSTQPNSVTRPTTFDTDSDTFHSELPTLITQINAAIVAMTAIAAGGAVSLQYTFSTTTTDADPGAGTVRLSSATQNTATVIRADLSGADGSDLTGVLALFDDSTSTNKGYLTIRHSTTPTKWLVFSVTSVASPSGYRNITASCVASSTASPFTNGDAVLLDFTPTGDKGDTGAAGTGITPQAVGFTLAGGTTSKTLTIDVDLTASAVATKTGTETFSNKRVTPRILSAASYTTDTGTSLNCDNLDEFIVTAQAGALKFNNPTGTPTDGQVLLIAVTGTAARALTYDTQFQASTVALPSTTVTTARLNLAFIWAAATSKWILLGAA